MYPTIEQMPVSTRIFLGNESIEIDYKAELLASSIKAKFLRLGIRLESKFDDLNTRTNAAFIEIKEKAGIL